MKKVFALVLALVLALCASAALADTFRMGIDAEYPPFSYLDDNGQYAGFDVEMCTAVCEMNGWELEIVPVNWDQKLRSLDAGEHDCIWSGMTITKAMRDEGYVLSIPYYDSVQVVMTTADSGITTLADLAGKAVAVQLGTSGEFMLEDESEDGQKALADTFAGGAAQLMENFTVCATELAAGGVDAVVIDKPNADTQMTKFPNFVLLAEELGHEQYGICFRKGDDALCAQVEESIKKLVEDGTYKALAEKYELELKNMCLLAE